MANKQGVGGVTNNDTTQQASTKGLPGITGQEDAAQLGNLLKNNWGKIKKGTNTISKKESEWIRQIGDHDKADAEVHALIKEKVATAKLSSSTQSSGDPTFPEWLEGLGAVQQPAPVVTPEEPPVVVEPPAQPVVDVIGEPDPSNVVPTPEPSPVIDVQQPNAGQVQQVATWRYDGDSYWPSCFGITPEALESDQIFKGVSPEKFGTCDVEFGASAAVLPKDLLQHYQGNTEDPMIHNVRDMHYVNGDGQIGMTLVPINDHGTVKAPTAADELAFLGLDADQAGKDLAGYEIMDAFIRKETGLGKDDEIFTYIAYVHPEEHHAGTIKELAKDMLKTEAGNTHEGVYRGNGKTTNSPYTYHDMQWHCKGYPANVQVISMQGVDQATFNKNGALCDSILNDDVVFPNDYKNDKFRTVDLNSNLMFYRDWIREGSSDPERAAMGAYLKTDNSWKTYCAEHKTIVANIQANVPHNEESFKQIFGAEEGKTLWAEFKERYKKLHKDADGNGIAFTAADETHFQPLWDKEGIDVSKIRPMEHEQYNEYHDKLATGKLDSYEGPMPLEPGKGMLWAPETTADIINDFIEMYGSFVDVGAALSSSLILGFMETALDRLFRGPDGEIVPGADKKFMELAMPVINKMMIAEAMVEADNPMWANEIKQKLYLAYGGKPEDLQAGTPDPKTQGIVDMAMQGLKAPAASMGMPGSGSVLDAIQMGHGIDRETAYGQLKEMIAPDIIKARKAAAVSADNTVFYSPPAVFHRVALGMHEKSKFITIREFGTAVDVGDAKLNEAA